MQFYKIRMFTHHLAPISGVTQERKMLAALPEIFNNVFSVTLFLVKNEIIWQYFAIVLQKLR